MAAKKTPTGKTAKLTSKDRNPKGGLSAAGRKKINAVEGRNLKAPAPNPKTEKDKGRRKSFCARSKGQMENFPKAAKDPNSRLRLARKAWNC